jgi:cysteine sulfinate desulfinase/cysteine desulfurase-like protein
VPAVRVSVAFLVTAKFCVTLNLGWCQNLDSEQVVLEMRLPQRGIYRLPNTLNVAFPNYVGADILARLDGVAASTGSACHSGRVELSPVLTAMGIRPNIAMGAIRFSLGRYTAIEEIDAVVDRLADVLAAGSRLNAKPPGLVEGTGRCSL